MSKSIGFMITNLRAIDRLMSNLYVALIQLRRRTLVGRLLNHPIDSFE
jgi:hypothetical protein